MQDSGRLAAAFLASHPPHVGGCKAVKCCAAGLLRQCACQAVLPLICWVAARDLLVLMGCATGALAGPAGRFFNRVITFWL